MASQIIIEAAVHATSTVEGDEIVNTFHYALRKLPGGDPDLTYEDLTLAAQDLANWLPLHVRKVVCETWKYLSTSVRCISPRVFETISIPTPSTLLGERTGDPLPTLNAICLSRRSALPGRSFRGRIYCAPLSELDVSGSYILQDLKTSAQAAALLLKSELHPSESLLLVPVIWSRETLLYSDIVRYAVDNRVCRRSSRQPRFS